MLKKLTFEEIQASRPQPEQVLKTQRTPVVAIADNIRSLHNVGALFRTSDGAFIEHLYLCGITGVPPRGEIRKTSLGAEETVPWSYEKDAASVITRLKKQGYQIVALEHTSNSRHYGDADYRFPLCLIVGNEYHGMQDHLVEMADLAIEIPMIGVKQSLNVSVAFGIALYEILQKYQQRKMNATITGS
ncbi:RNA methyltransferase [candidate division KSB1 bacterium]|nr:RNA methyltransferase [candidate division KSB1 bacterium]